MADWTRDAPLDPVESRLLQQIRDNPSDDGPRLVYADFLSARGDPRGELIVLQCEIHRGRPRPGLEQSARALLERHREVWLGPQAAQGLELERGFLNHPLAVHAEDRTPRHRLFRLSPTLYETVRAAGREGLGALWEAVELGPQGAVGRVGLKVYREDWPGDPSREAVRDEDRAGRLCRHPSIVQHRGLAYLDGLPVLVREWLDGLDLTQVLDKSGGSLPPQLAAAVVLALGRGLEHIHAQGLWYGRICTDSIILTRDGRVVLVDIGWIKASEEGLKAVQRDRDRIRPPGWIDHLSPELERGHPLDGRTDIFSTASLLSTLLVGRPPFRRETATASFVALRHEEPEPLAGHAAVLQQVVHRALRKQVQSRTQRMGQLMEELVRVWRAQQWGDPARIVARAVAALLE